MMKYISVLLALLCAVSLVAAPKQSKKTILPPDVPKKFDGKNLEWVKNALSPEFLLERTTAIARDFVSKKDLTIHQSRFYIDELKQYDQYYFLESDSGFSRRWIKANIAYAEALMKAKAKIAFLVDNKKTATEEYRKWYDYYVKTAKQYWAVSKKPIKVQDKKKIARLNKIKAVVVEQLKAKEDAEKARQPVLNEKKKKNRK